MTEQPNLIFRNGISELGRVTAFISSLCAREAIPVDMEYDLTLALDEMVTNVAENAHPGDREHQLAVRLSLNEDEFVAQIEDEGREFDPTPHPTPEFNAPQVERKVGGLGIPLAWQIMDTTKHERVEGKILSPCARNEFAVPSNSRMGLGLENGGDQ